MTLPPSLLALLLLLAAASPGPAAWRPVPPMDWSRTRPADFADHELVIPYHLEHFHRLANAVVESGPTRGFIALPVWRDKKDNQPYNVRVLENHVWFAYFYVTRRPWNPYFNSPAVRERLEAILEFWVRSQAPDGRFAEYRPEGWGLAPTGFGVLHMSHTLDLLAGPGPDIDPALFERVLAAQRKAILAVLQHPDLRRTARGYSNQAGGVYRAATRYLKLRPDPELERAFIDGAAWAAGAVQSPAGFLYEAGYPDFGYSRVQDANLLHVDPLLDQVPAPVRRDLLSENNRWNDWLSYNLVLEPGRPVFLINAPTQRRTSAWSQWPADRPFSRNVPVTRAFARTAEEAAADTARRRADLERTWPRQPELRTYKPLTPAAWGIAPLARPTAAERDAALARLPYLARTGFTQLRVDALPLAFLYVRRPGYYAIFNSGANPADRFPLGLGLVWHPDLGTILQGVPDQNIAWGTLAANAARPAEHTRLRAALTVDQQPVHLAPGIHSLSNGVVTASYVLPGTNRPPKRVTFEHNRLRVSVRGPGPVTEQLPLLLRPGDALDLQPRRIELRRGTARCVIAFSQPVTVRADRRLNAGPFTRRILQVSADAPLDYEFIFDRTVK